MRLNLSRLPSLLLSALLQLSPLLRVASAEATAVASPLVAVLRWIVGASAVAGSFHAVSGATGLTVTPGSTGTNGVPFGARATIISSAHGTAKSYSAVASTLPPGVAMSRQGVFSGVPTKAGSFKTTLTGWQNSNTTGDRFTTTTTFTIKAALGVVPTITQPPSPQTVTEGDPVTFAVIANGTPAPTFQWTFNGAAINGATAAQYQIAKAALADDGLYAVIASNPAGSVPSAAVRLTVNPAAKAPTITVQPVSQTATESSNVVFTVTAGGTAPLAYQWTFNDSPIAEATSSALTLAGLTTAQAGSYRVKVSNVAGSVLSDLATLTVTPLPLPGPVLLSVPVVTDQGVTFRFPALAGVAYVVERRAALGSGAWITLTNVPPAAATGDAEVTDEPSDTERWYRIRPQP